MKNLRQYNQYRVKLWGMYGDNSNGKFIIPRKNKSGYYQVIASDGLDWDHVSISLLDSQKNPIERCLRWEEMCEIKEMFFLNTETVVQIHPKKEDYINDHPYVLHLWRPNNMSMPLPNKDDMLQKKLIHKEIFPRKDGFYLIRKFKTTDWEWVSIILLDKEGNILRRYPKWAEMCEVKDICFNEDEAVIEIHGDINFNADAYPYTLNLFKPLTKEMPLPNPLMVGVTKKYTK